MKNVKIQKISASNNPLFETPKIEDYEVGKDNGDVSLPIEYTIEGTLVAPIEIGKPVSVLRKKRNGISMIGLFTTSEVVKKTEKTFETKNSVYTIEEI